MARLPNRPNRPPEPTDPTIDFLAPTPADLKTGRPCSYHADIAIEILTRMIEGETLTSICRDPRMPSRKTVYWWQVANPAFCDAFLAARRAWADVQIERAVSAAEQARDKDSAQAARVQAETFLRVAAMTAPERWSERRQMGSQVTISLNTNLGGDGPADRASPKGQYTITLDQ